MNKSESGKLGYLMSKATLEEQKQERIRQYNLNPVICKQCGKPLDYQRKNNKFCNSSCSAKYSNAQRKHIPKDYGNCAYCGKPLTHKGKYCNNECQGKHTSEVKYQREIELWKLGKLERVYTTNGNVIPTIKRYLLEKYNHKCAQCGWDKVNPYTNKQPLEVHHIDGNWQNNTEENLIILCPNCHSLTDTYKASNKGKGRGSRKI